MSRLGAGFGFGVVDFEGEGALLGVRVAGLGDFVARASNFDGLGVGSRAGCRGGIGGVVGEAELSPPWRPGERGFAGGAFPVCARGSCLRWCVG